MGFQWTSAAPVVADLASDPISLSDIGAGAVIGGVLGETAVRLAAALGFEPQIDGWREGMFVGALLALVYWASGRSVRNMGTMWERRLLSVSIAVLLMAAVAAADVRGYAVFLAVAVIVPVALLAGAGADAWLQARRHRTQS